MKQVKLGLRGPIVSEVCFGSLAISPLQGKVTESEGQRVLEYAFERGVNWVDTAEIYGNYAQLNPVLARHPETKVVSKSYSVTREEMRHSLEKARQGLGRDVIDFFLLHEQESALTLRGHQEAWEELLHAKEQGIVQWVGISTHAAAGVRAGALQPGLDVIHPILNRQGIGIIDGTLKDMLDSVQFAAELGIGLYAMKVFAGGHLGSSPQESLAFIQGLAHVPAMALGMSSQAEVDYNLRFLAGEPISEALAHAVQHRERQLVVAEWCEGCGKCVEACPQGALHVEEQARVNAEDCVLCGYCGRACPHFCLKIV